MHLKVNSYPILREFFKNLYFVYFNDSKKNFDWKVFKAVIFK